jgi:GNAT superfamily N-acetyltransferase
MILPKNRHQEAAKAILGNSARATALVNSLERRSAKSYEFHSVDAEHYELALLFVHNNGATTTCLASVPNNQVEIEAVGNLIASSVASLCNKSIDVVQTIMGVDDHRLASAFELAGFERLAILTFMERVKGANQENQLLPALTYTSLVHATEKELQEILESTYVGSLDCPKIHGLRKIRDIVHGHRNQGQYDAKLWKIAALDGVPVGVLLLNPAKEVKCMELAYLGCTPESRGMGVGDALLKKSIEMSEAYGLPRITLAVDSDNSPAVQLYLRWNFKRTRQRLTYIQKLSTRC